MLLNEPQIMQLREAIYAMQFALKEAEKRSGSDKVVAFVAAWNGSEVNVELWRMMFILRMAEQAIDRHERARRRSLRALRERNRKRKPR